MELFLLTFGNLYILVGVDHVSKWVEDVACKINYHKVVLKLTKENIFAKFGIPEAIISDGGSCVFFFFFVINPSQTSCINIYIESNTKSLHVTVTKQVDKLSWPLGR